MKALSPAIETTALTRVDAAGVESDRRGADRAIALSDHRDSVGVDRMLRRADLGVGLQHVDEGCLKMRLAKRIANPSAQAEGSTASAVDIAPLERPGGSV